LNLTTFPEYILARKPVETMMVRNFSSILLVLLTRNTTAFSSRLTTSRPSGSSSLGWIQNRGGATATSTTATFATPSLQTADKELKKEAIEQSLSIVGKNLIRSTFGGVTYFNTSCMPEFRVLFILGGPGAGKGTQSAFLEEQYPCVHLSVGELLREEQTREDSPHRALIEECLVAGKIVPVEISLALLQRAMEEAAEEKGRSLLFLVDGFPRNFDNLDGWNRCMSGIASVWAVLMYSCPLKILEDRILARAETSGRSDDNIKSAQKRFRTFEEQTVPVVNTLREVQEIQEEEEKSMAMQVEDIKGDRTIEEVWNDTQNVINKMLANDVWTANAKLMEAIESGNEEHYSSLCDYLEKSEDISTHEGGDVGKARNISNAEIEFETGTNATTSYDRVIDGITTRETRVWSHQGVKGWRCIHFYRTPKS